jgi:hypothetical protein
MIYENAAGHGDALHADGGVGRSVEVSRRLDEGVELRAARGRTCGGQAFYDLRLRTVAVKSPR